MNLKILNVASIILILFFTMYILYIGKSLILPLMIALIFWYIIIRLTAVYKKISWNRRKFPPSLAFTLAIITTAIVLYLFFMLLGYSVADIIPTVPKYQQKLQDWLTHINELTYGRIDTKKLIAEINLTSLFSTMAIGISLVASNFFLIVVYVLFLLLEQRTFKNKLKSICKSPEQYSKINGFLSEIDHDINRYLKIKTGINLIAGVLSFIVLLCFGVEYAQFWGVMFFLVHYVPYLGPTVGILFVLLAASVQITHLATFIILGVLLIVIQFGIGNFLEPHWLGTRLNLSPIVILLSLAFWGSLWGVLGMMLCVPIMVIITIILSKFPTTRPIAIALSAEGKTNSS